MGVTLLELMLAILMAGIMIAVGFSALRTHSVRREITATLTGTAELKTAVAEIYVREQRVPSSDHDRGLEHAVAAATGPSLAAVRVVDGRLDLVYGSAAAKAVAGRVLPLTPYETADLEVVWICGNRIPGPGLKPLGFSAGGPSAVQTVTTIEARFLPAECR